MKSAEKKTITPKVDKSANGKKLVQARLPFKVIATKTTSPAAAVTTSNASGKGKVEVQPKKRKLSYTDEKISKKIACAGDRENCSLAQEVVEVVLSSDDDVEGTKAKVPESVANRTEDTMNPFVKLESVDRMVTALKNQNTGRIDLSPRTPKIKRKSIDKGSGDSTPTDKFLIKMSWSSNKKKRKHAKKDKDAADTDSDIEIVQGNPEKKIKIDVELKPAEEQKISNSIDNVSNKKANVLEKCSKSDDEVLSVKTEEENSPASEQQENNEPKSDDVIEIEDGANSNSDSDEVMKMSEDNDQLVGKRLNRCKSTENVDQSKPATPSPSKDYIELDTDSSDNSSTSLSKIDKPSSDLDESKSQIMNKSQALTSRQIKRNQEAEKKQKAKEEREKKLLEEKFQRQKEKEDKEKQRKKEREEKEEQKRKEREEKEEQRRKEKEEKEKKRLAEVEAKNEERRQKEDERRKKEEGKEEERKKKEDEKRKKELEKEEVENKKKKAAEAFTKFFVQQQKSTAKSNEDRLSVDSDIQIVQQNFMPFQIKGDMKLAPLFRRIMDKKSKSALDNILISDELETIGNLYLNCLKTGKIAAGKDSRTRLKDDDFSDVVIAEDELKGAGQSIDDEKKPVEKFRTKLFLFRENVRPPYFGTWRKKSTVIGPRRPFATDKAIFDYEVDSDDEWEEEEPGESLHGSDDEKESEDEYEVDNEFFVPHGHLSDEELQNEDELDDDNTPETQKAKLKILQQEFAQEMKKKTEQIKPRLIGIVWADPNGNQPSTCPSVIWQSLNKCAMLFSETIVLVEPEPTANDTAASTQKEKPARPKLTDDLVRDLIRLVHFNRHRKEFMIREFKAYLADKFRSDLSFPNYTKISIRNKIEKIAKWEMFKDVARKKNKLCWIVSTEMLKRYEMDDMGITNKWKYTLQPNSHSLDVEPVLTEKPVVIEFESNDSNYRTKTPAVITKFTKVLSDLEKAQQFKSMVIQSPVVHQKKSPDEKNLKTVIVHNSTAPVVKKRVPLLMSVPRGQKIPENTKSDLISKFLKKDQSRECNETAKPAEIGKVSPMDVDETALVVVEID